MICLLKRLSIQMRSLIAWTSHKGLDLKFIPEKKETQPFDMLIHKAQNFQICGAGSILAHFSEPNDRDFIYWLSGLHWPLNPLQQNALVNRARKETAESLTNLMIFNLLEGSQVANQSGLDEETYRSINQKGVKKTGLVERILNAPVKSKSKGKNKGKKGKQEKSQKSEKKAQKQKPKKKEKEPVDPKYLELLKNAQLIRWNKGQEIDTSSERRNVLITSALPYVNNEPHLGNLIGAVLSGDVYTRYARLSGYNTIHMCGTDEYGTATEIKALGEGLTPQQICDKYHKIHANIYDFVGIDFDHFGRTTTQEHKELVQDMYRKVEDNGFFLEKTVEQTFCENCARYLADRFIAATCPACGEEAKGDQCDSCGKTLEIEDLLNPICAICKGSVIKKDSDHLFLDLIKVKPQLAEFVQTSEKEGQWTNNSSSITGAWLKKARPRCITRDLEWGIPVPREGYESKCFYVWFDAPIGYVSITANYTKHWKNWWFGPEQEPNKKHVELYQFMGKDNVPFHTIFWPGCLLASGQPWTMLKHINTTEYLNYEDIKFSKSNNTGIFGSHIAETGIPIEVWRYYLLANRPESADTQFKWEDFRDRNNSELLQNLGNFCHRVLKYIYVKNGKKIPLIDEALLDAQDTEFLEEVWKQTQETLGNYEKVKLRNATSAAMRLSSMGNKFAQDVQVWTMKDDIPKRNNKLAILVALIRLLAGLLEPIMPSWSAKVYIILNFKRSREEQELFRTLREVGEWKALVGLVREDNMEPEMNLPVPLFQKSNHLLFFPTSHINPHSFLNIR